jgi:C1q domain
MPFLGNEPSNTFVSIAKQTITGNGGTSYALSYPVASANDIDVFYNNVRQEPGVAYTASGSTIAFTEAIASTDSVYILYNGQAIGTVNAPEGAYLPTTGGTLNGELSVNNRVVIQQDSTSNNRLTLRGKPSSSYRWNIDNFDSANTLRIFRENDSDGSAGAVFAQIDANGRVTTPYQPTFCAYANTTNGYSDSPLKYDVALLNIGSHYNTSTYRFTAPVSGNYFFSFSIWTGSASVTRCGFYKNGSPVGNSSYPIGTRNHGGAQDNDSASVIISLSVNDYVDIRCYEGAVAIFGTNYFLGRLIG